MLRVVQLDRRQAIYDGLCAIAESARTRPFAFLKLVEMIGDRIEGKPTQHVINERRRSTEFIEQGHEPTPPPPSPEELATAILDEARGTGETVDPTLAIPLPMQGLAVLPPPGP